MLVSLPRSRRKAEDNNKESSETPPSSSLIVNDKSIITFKLTEDIIRHWQEQYDDNVEIHAVLPIDSLLTLANALGSTALPFDRPLQAYSLPIQTFARFDRWTEIIQELDGKLQGVAHHIPGQIPKSNLMLSMDCGTRSLKLNADPDWSPNSERGDFFDSAFSFDELHSFLAKVAQRADRGDFFVATRTRRGSRTLQRKRAACPLNNQKSIRHEDILHITEIVKGILDKLALIGLWSLCSIFLMQRASFSDAEIDSVLRRRTVDELMADMCMRGEIPYGLHWLRDWYPVWAVQRWDPSWSRERVFGSNGEGIFCSRNGEGTAVKELRALYRARYQEILESECTQPYGIHHYTWAKFGRSYYYYV